MSELDATHQHNEELQSQLEHNQSELAGFALRYAGGQGLGDGDGGKSSESKGEGEGEGEGGGDQDRVDETLATTVFDDEDSMEEKEEEERRRAEREAAVAEAVAAERQRMWELSEKAAQQQLEGLEMQMARQVEELDAYRQRLEMAQLQVNTHSFWC